MRSLLGLLGLCCLFLSVSCGGGSSKNIRDYMTDGRNWFEKGDYERALAEFNEAIEKYPDNYGPYHGRGWVWLEKKDYLAALADFDKVIELQSDFSLAYKARSYVWEKIGRLSDAIADLEHYLELEPDDPDASARLVDLVFKFKSKQAKPPNPLQQEGEN